MSIGHETVGGKELNGEELAKLFGVKTANDWMRTAADKPVPKMLFGEFWLEGAAEDHCPGTDGAVS
jgi:hypothetical protein